MPAKPSTNKCDKHNSMINRHIGTAYDTVKIVADNIEIIEEIGDNLPYLFKYLGAYSTPPTQRPDGSPLQDGDYYFDSVSEALIYYKLATDDWFEVDPQEILDARDEALAAQVASEAAQTAAELAETNAAQSATTATQEANRAEVEADRSEQAAAASANSIVARGAWDASLGEFPTPTLTPLEKADWYRISVAGTMMDANPLQPDVSVEAQDNLYWDPVKDIWYAIRNLDLVRTVDGQQGDVVVDKYTQAEVDTLILPLTAGVVATGTIEARTLEDRFADVINVRDFGAIGDGVADDTVAIQAAIDFLYNRIPRGGVLHFPYGQYRITSTLDGRNAGANWNLVFMGDARPVAGTPGSRIVMDSITASTLIVCDGGFQAADMEFSYPGSRNRGTNASPTYLLDIDNNNTFADIDAVIERCIFDNFHRAIRVKGRGLTVHQCDFTNGGDNTEEGCAVDFDFPSPFTPGDIPDQVLTEGMRAYQIRNCRFHAMTGYAMRNKGYNANNIKGVHFTGNYIDTQAGILRGTAKDIHISNNTILNSSSIHVWVEDNFDCNNLNITSNMFIGGRDESVGQPYRSGGTVSQADIDAISIGNILFVSGTGNSASGIVIDGNTISDTIGDVFVNLRNTDSFTVTDNSIRRPCKQNFAGPTDRHIIKLNNQTVNGLEVSGNVIKLRDDNARTALLLFGDANINGYNLNDNYLSGPIFSTFQQPQNNDFGGQSGSTYCFTYTGQGGTADTTKLVAARYPKAVVITQVTGTAIGNTFSCCNGSSGGNVRLNGQTIFAQNDFNLSGETYSVIVHF